MEGVFSPSIMIVNILGDSKIFSKVDWKGVMNKSKHEDTNLQLFCLLNRQNSRLPERWKVWALNLLLVIIRIALLCNFVSLSSLIG